MTQKLKTWTMNVKKKLYTKVNFSVFFCIQIKNYSLVNKKKPLITYYGLCPRGKPCKKKTRPTFYLEGGEETSASL